MAEKIILEGNKYIGKFSIEQRSSEQWTYIDGEYAGARWEKTKRSWWEGKGAIKDIQTGDKQRFQFFPKGNSKIDIIPYLSINELKNKVKVDAALNLLYEQARESEDIYPQANLELVVA